MKIIPLTQGKVALVDDNDYEKLNQHKWYAHKASNFYYAVRMVNTTGGGRKHVGMHTEIIGIKTGYMIDHRDGNTLNNQRFNLRHVTNRQNQQNRHTPKASKYPGVTFRTGRKKIKWRARITVDKKVTHLGYFDSEIEAFKAYQIALREMVGDEFNVNDNY